jgi:glutathione S-transferase
MHVNHQVLGDAEFNKQCRYYFFAPWQYPKEVHKQLKQLDRLMIGKKESINDGFGQKITLVDFFIFNEVLTLNLTGHDLTKYPNVVAYLKRMSAQYPELLDTNKSIEVYAKMKNQQFYLDRDFNPTNAKL